LLFAILVGCSAALPGGSTLGPRERSKRAGGKPLGPAVPGITRDAECSTDQVGRTLVRRLSRTEYERSVAALFPGLELPKQNFAADLSVHGFENNSASLNPSTLLIEQYHNAAMTYARVAATNPEKILPCTPRGPDIACASQFIERFGLHAFRRPLTSEERYRYETFFTHYMRKSSFEVALELVLQAFLQAPQFLYRLELSTNTQRQGESVALDDYEMASRLSFFLWQSMPDDVLFEAAAQGRTAHARPSRRASATHACRRARRGGDRGLPPPVARLRSAVDSEQGPAAVPGMERRAGRFDARGARALRGRRVQRRQRLAERASDLERELREQAAG
jgi:hypothetical protein